MYITAEVYRAATMAEHFGGPPFLPTRTPGATQSWFPTTLPTLLSTLCLPLLAVSNTVLPIITDPSCFHLLSLSLFFFHSSVMPRVSARHMMISVSNASGCTAQPPSAHSDLCHAEVAWKSPADFHRVRI